MTLPKNLNNTYFTSNSSDLVRMDAVDSLGRHNVTGKSYDDHAEHAHTEFAVTPSVLLTLCSVAVVENIFVCFIIITNQRMRRATNVFIVGLCITNVLCAGVLLPTHCFDPDGIETNFLVIIVILIYICNLTAVTFERFVAVTWPLRYHSIMTKKFAIRVTISCYIAPVIYGTLPLSWGANPFTVAHKVYLSATLIVFLVLPLLFILFVYGKVYLTIHKFFKRHSKHIVANSDSTSTISRRSQIWAEAKFVCCLHRSTIGENNGNDDAYELTTPDGLFRRNSKRGSMKRRDNETLIENHTIYEEENIDSNLEDEEGIETSFNPFDSILSLNPSPSQIDSNSNGHVNKMNSESKNSLSPNIHRETIHTFLSPKIDEVETKVLFNEGRLKSRHTELSLGVSKKHVRALRSTMSATEISQHSNLSINNNVSFSAAKEISSKTTKKIDSTIFDKRRKSSTYFSRRKSSSLRSSTRSWLKFNAKAKQTITELKASMAFAMVAMTYMFTWLPVVYMSFLDLINEGDHIPPLLRAVSTYTIGLNSMIDPLLYAFLLKEFRVTIGRIVRNRKSTRLG